MKTFTVEVTQVVTVRQEAVDAAAVAAGKAIYGESFDPFEHAEQFDFMEQVARAVLANIDDLTAASQLEHSGLISREKYNHIVENIRARESIRGAMA